MAPDNSCNSAWCYAEEEVLKASQKPHGLAKAHRVNEEDGFMETRWE
jgi:hypothetical protein